MRRHPTNGLDLFHRFWHFVPFHLFSLTHIDHDTMSDFPSIADLNKERCDQLHEIKDRYLLSEFLDPDARVEEENRILAVYNVIGDCIKRGMMEKQASLRTEKYDLDDIVWSCIAADLDVAGFHVRLIDRRPDRKNTFKTTLEELEISW